jgi:hypothetical protein
MDATLDYSNRKASRPLSERINFRLVGFLGAVSLLFIWGLWTILDPRIAVKEGDYYYVDLKGMGNFPLDPKRDTEAVIPAQVRELNGKKVKFNGEMFAPSAASQTVQEFQLVYSIVECCMGGPPKVQERVFAKVPPKVTAYNYSGRQVTVVGTLHVKLEKLNGEAVSVFTMEVDEVQERT